MKQGHPTYGPVAFRDVTTGTITVTRSTLAGRPGLPTVDVDGVTYPLVDVDVTSASHPFWTGRQRTIDTEGRVAAYARRFGATKASR